MEIDKLIQQIVDETKLTKEDILSEVDEVKRNSFGMINSDVAALNNIAAKNGVTLDFSRAIEYVKIEDLTNGVCDKVVKATVRFVGDKRIKEGRNGAYETTGIIISDTDDRNSGIWVNMSGKNIDKTKGVEKGDLIQIRNFIVREYNSKKSIVVSGDTVISFSRVKVESKEMSLTDAYNEFSTGTEIVFSCDAYVANNPEIKQGSSNGKDWKRMWISFVDDLNESDLILGGNLWNEKISDFKQSDLVRIEYAKITKSDYGKFGCELDLKNASVKKI